MPTFPDDVVSAVLTHMNSDHRDDNLLIVRAFADASADAATMVSLDGAGGYWTYAAVGETRALTLPWSVAITERAEIRREIVVLYEAACERLGIERRPH
ncbi:DUF2470 domain-containing protein [Glaciihabitans sp. UYNi722]|uniref:DUF2470 domain-containing protein n=1 Tax=Glaciihabitans sp. UYNi722 TaxID=3156344 RepID=UPI0033992971